MTQREQQILQLIEEDPMISQQQIAEALGYSENAVSVRLNRCRSKLRTYLEQEGYFHERKTQ